MTTNCIAKKRDGVTLCNIICEDNNKFCIKYHKYLEIYTQEMLDNLIFCKKCKKFKYEGQFKGKTCDLCINKIHTEREVIRDEKKKLPKCLECNNPIINNGKHCGNHKIDQLLFEIKTRGNIPCKYFETCKQEISYDDDKDDDENINVCIKCIERINIKMMAKNKNKSVQENIYLIKKEIIKHEINKSCNICGIRYSIDKLLNCDNIFIGICKICDNLHNSKRDMTDITCEKHYTILKNHIGKLWNLTEDYFDKKINDNCFYCDDKISTTLASTISSIKGSDFSNEEYIVSACRKCFVMKEFDSHEIFMQKCTNIYNNFAKNTEIMIDDKIETLNYKIILQIMKFCSIKFSISKDKYINYIKNKCHMCNNTNSKKNIFAKRDPLIGYVEQNTFLSICNICDVMRSNFYIEQFYNHILKILAKQNIITEQTAKELYKEKLRLTKLQKIAYLLSQPKIKNHRDRRKCTIFKHNSKHYIDMIWNGYNLNNFFPELEFCNTKEQLDIWKFYRIAISSYRYSGKTPGRDVRILIRDKYSKQYVGIASISSALMDCAQVDNFIGWSHDAKCGRMMINNIFNITTCVAIPPFSYNFNGGKLILKLMFSKEVAGYCNNKYKNCKIGGFVTYSLHGKGQQYYGLKEIEFIGLTSGYGNDLTFINDKIYHSIKVYEVINKFNISKDRMHVISNFCKRYGINNSCYHGRKRGIYFGYTTNLSKDFLNGKINDISFDKMGTVETIGLEWIIEIAKKRFEFLVEKKKLRFYHDYDYYWSDQSSYNRANSKKNYVPLNIDNNKESIKNDIIGLWYRNNNIPKLQISTLLSEKYGKTIQRPFIESTLNIYTNISNEYIEFKNNIMELMTNYHISKDKINIDKFLEKEFLKTDIMKKDNDKKQIFKMKKNNIFMLLDSKNKDGKFNGNIFQINEFEKNKWNAICKINALEQRIIVECITEDKIIDNKCITYDNGPYAFNHIMLSQTDIKKVEINEDFVLARLCNVTSKGNIIIRNHYGSQYIVFNISKNINNKIIKLEIIFLATSHYCKCLLCSEHKKLCICDRCTLHRINLNYCKL